MSWKRANRAPIGLQWFKLNKRQSRTFFEVTDDCGGSSWPYLNSFGLAAVLLDATASADTKAKRPRSREDKQNVVPIHRMTGHESELHNRSLFPAPLGPIGHFKTTIDRNSQGRTLPNRDHDHTDVDSCPENMGAL